MDSEIAFLRHAPGLMPVGDLVAGFVALAAVLGLIALSRQNPISREEVYRLKATLTSEGATADAPSPKGLDRASEAGPSTGGTYSDPPENTAVPAAATAAEPARPPKGAGGVVLWASYRGTDVTIDLKSVPVEDGFVFVRKSVGGEALCARASDLRLVRATTSRR